ncbi:MAG: hypothetical protein H0U74_04055 [Bradymonadaceae bacterium]|nr:hypothetical protein [Lujinxingiaceae bacterium]
MKHLLLLTMLLLASAACATQNASPASDASPAAAIPASGVAFTTTRSAYVRNEKINVNLVNHTAHDVGYNLCYTRIDMRIEGAWHAAENFPDFCDQAARRLEAGQRADYVIAMAEALPAGEYRIVTLIENPLGATPEQLETAVLSLQD